MEKVENKIESTNHWDKLVTDWSVEDMVEIDLKEPDDFLKIAETLTRIGIESKNEKKLTQSCHILHKKGRYFIVSFKEMFLLDGKVANLTVSDIYRRNTIAKLLENWNLFKIVDPSKIEEKTYPSLKQIKIIPYSQKGEYELVSKYSIGKNRRPSS